MASRGMLTGLWRQMERILFKRELVGIDVFGNQYYRVWAKDDFGALQEKRICKPRNSDPTEYTPESMPTEWSSWLRRQRREPPTEEEIARYAVASCVPTHACIMQHSNDATRLAIQQKVALLQAEELKRRLQAEARGGYQQAAAEPNLGRFLDQMSRVGGAPSTAPADTAASSPQATAAEAQVGSTPPPSKGSFQPGAWTPGSE